MDVRAAIAEVPLWYHTLEVAPGVETPGWFDLRPIVDKLPWPDVKGKRCLDVGTYDGFLAFELEKRGAAEVVCTDIESHEDWDWPPTVRERGSQWFDEHAHEEKGMGFRVAKELLGSSVERVFVSIYDLDPGELGQFDVIVCGSLFLHLRDPFRALAALRSVCGGQFMSAEEIDPWLSATHPRRPAARIDGTSNLFQWFIPNIAGHVRMLEAAGFTLERQTGAYAVPFGVSHPPRRGLDKLPRRLYTRGEGVPHHAILARA